jgi:hypothetical protein
MDVATAEVFDVIRERLTRCCNDHTKCNGAIAPLLPTRVLDVGLNSNSQTLKLHLSGEGERGPYVALSYC